MSCTATTIIHLSCLLICIRYLYLGPCIRFWLQIRISERCYDSDDTHHIWISLSRLEHLHRRTASLGCGHVAAATRGVLAVTAMAMMTHSSASRPSVDRIASSWPQPVTVFSCYRRQWLILQIKKQLLFIFNSILINLY